MPSTLHLPSLCLLKTVLLARSASLATCACILHGAGFAGTQVQGRSTGEPSKHQLQQSPPAAGRQGEHGGGAGALALAFVSKVVLMAAGLVVLSFDLPLLAREFLYSECPMGGRELSWLPAER